MAILPPFWGFENVEHTIPSRQVLHYYAVAPHLGILYAACRTFNAPSPNVARVVVPGKLIEHFERRADSGKTIALSYTGEERPVCERCWHKYVRAQKAALME
jgi:hypothetical protein